MKKLAVFLMIPALVLLAASTAPAFDFHHWGGIQGTYAMTATGNCLWAPAGFNPVNYLSSNAYSSHFTAQGIWIFEANGTGKAEVTQFGITAPPVVGAPDGNLYFAGAASVKYSFDFDYTLTYGGEINVWPKNLHATFLSGPKKDITYTVEPVEPQGAPAPIKYFGMVSNEWDHKTLTVNSGNELQLYSFTTPAGASGGTCYGICNSSRVLIRVGY
jgi:hypothetical protein